MHYDFELKTLKTGQPDMLPAHLKNTVCIVPIKYLVLKSDKDLVSCMLDALAQLCFQLLLFCLSGLPPVSMRCNMLGIIQHTSLWMRVV